MTHRAPVLLTKGIVMMMSMQFLTAIGATTGLCLLAVAQETKVRTEAPCIWLSSELVGLNVLSSEGEKIGKVEDFVVQSDGVVAYAASPSAAGWEPRARSSPCPGPS
jgi:hypothetical protein